MALQMEKAGGSAANLQAHPVHVHGRSSAPSNHAEELAAGSCAANHTRQDEAKRVSPPAVSPVRECPRQIRTMSGVREQMEVESKSRDVARFPWISKLLYTVAAIAVSVLNDGHNGNNQVQSQGEAQSKVLSDSSYLQPFSGTTTNFEFDYGDGISGLGPYVISGGAADHATGHGAEHRPLHPRKLPSSSTDGGQWRHRDSCLGQHASHRGAGVRHGQRKSLRLGQRRRITGELNRAIEVMEAERQIFDALPTTSSRPTPNLDVFELFAGSSKFMLLARHHQLNALQPLDWLHGPDQDLHDPGLRRQVVEAVKRYKPWALIMGLDCRLWSIFNENLNYSQRKHRLQQLREEEKELVLFACELALIQHRSGRFFLIENPQRSRLWVLTEIVELLNMPQTWLVTLDTGAFGATVEDKKIAKPMNFLGNIPFLDEVLGQRLSMEDKQFCTPIQGTMTKKSQEYPDSLVHLILKYIKKAI